ncbi:MAG: hypothetical protein ACRC8A_05975 [Microcoleaceae cyanobacterium]
MDASRLYWFKALPLFSRSRKQGQGWLAFMVMPLASVGLFAASASAFPRFDLTTDQDYATCATNLTAVGLSSELAAKACAGMVRPQNLSQCVTRISQDAAIAPEEALASCVSVRRPEELAICVVNITQEGGDVNSSTVLNSCRRSLLPERHAFCVLGLTRGGGIAVDQALGTCLNPPEQFIDLRIEQPQAPSALPNLPPDLPPNP